MPVRTSGARQVGGMGCATRGAEVGWTDVARVAFNITELWLGEVEPGPALHPAEKGVCFPVAAHVHPVCELALF